MYFDTSILIVFQDSITKVIKFDSQMIAHIKIDTLIKCLVCLLVMSIVTALKFCTLSDADEDKSKCQNIIS